MRLKSVKIHNYKCFVDLDEVEIADDVTCLVGMNETGKSAFLELLALNKSIDGCKISKKDKSALIPLCEDDDFSHSCTWQVTDKDIDYFNSYYGFNFLKTDSIKISYNYKGEYEINYSDIFPTEAELRSKYFDILKINNTDDTIVKFIQNSDVNNYIITNFKKIIDHNGYNSFYQILFHIIYYDLIKMTKIITDVDIIQNIININEYYSYTNNRLNNNVFYNYLNDNGLTFKVIKNYIEGDIDTIKRVLQQISKKINISILDFFPDESMSIQLNAEITHSNEKIISTTFKDRNDEIMKSIEFNERSMGIRYILSYLLYIESTSDSDIGLLLLDEPGLHLHPGAQQKLIQYIYKLAEQRGFQIIYSTHSPFMINRDNIDKVQIFKSNGNHKMVSGIVHEKDEISLMPLKSALGYDLSQCLFIGNQYLLVEGWSDELYIKEMMSVVALNYKLHDKWIILPTQGTTDIVRVYKILKSQGFNVVILRDYKSTEQEAIEREINKNNEIKKELEERILYYKDFFEGMKDAEVEDLFGMEFYYQLMKNIKPEISEKQDALLKIKNFKGFEGFMRTNYDYKICHADCAKVLRNKGFNNIEFENKSKIIKKFENLFDKINSFLG